MGGAQTAPYRGGFVRTVIVHDQMHLQARWHVAPNGSEEFQELLGTMAPVQLTNYFAAGYIERSK